MRERKTGVKDEGEKEGREEEDREEERERLPSFISFSSLRNVNGTQQLFFQMEICFLLLSSSCISSNLLMCTILCVENEFSGCEHEAGIRSRRIKKRKEKRQETRIQRQLGRKISENRTSVCVTNKEHKRKLTEDRKERKTSLDKTTEMKE